MRYIISTIILVALFSARPLIAAPLVVNDLVLASDTVWSGEILVEGVVVVGRKATLRIEPGTIVRFRKTDRNHDGIGDAEIRVMGRLLAVGTSAERIRFTSAATAPAPKDWSYVLIYTSARESEIRFCEFSHAFSGLQVHFSKARVTDSLFENNHEGLRFGRAELLVSHNVFRQNETGIRFTRMEGPASISRNQIVNNRLGIFVAPSSQNIPDFFTPDRGRVWNTGQLQIVANNIHDNLCYDLDLGEKQLWDTDVAGNWWGTTEVAAIAGKIFDQNRDPALGRAIFSPAAATWIRDAGIRDGS